MSVVWPKFHRWQQPSKNGNHVVKIAVIRNGSDRQTNGLKVYIQCSVSRVICVFFSFSHYISSFVLFEYLMVLVSSLKRLQQLLDLALSHFMISTEPD